MPVLHWLYIVRRLSTATSPFPHPTKLSYVKFSSTNTSSTTKETKMKLGVEPHFGRIIGDPTHITECIGDPCRKTVPLQIRMYAAIQLAQLRQSTAKFTLQHSLEMVAQFMLCEECRWPRSRAKIAQKWIAEGKKCLATIHLIPSASENGSQLLPMHYWPTSVSHSIHDIRRLDNMPRNACTRYA